MKQLFLTSSVSFVANDIAKRIHLKPQSKKLLFIATPAEVETGDLQWLQDDRDSLVKAGFIVENYTLTGKTNKEVKEKVATIDVIYMSGGNQFYFMEKINQCGFKEIIHEHVNKGKLYIGTSAGSVVASPNIEVTKRIDTAEYAERLSSYEGLGLVDFLVFPHWGSDYFRDVYMNTRLDLAYNTKNKIILLTDNQYVHVQDDTYQIIDVTRSAKRILFKEHDLAVPLDQLKRSDFYADPTIDTR